MNVKSPTQLRQVRAKFITSLLVTIYIEQVESYSQYMFHSNTRATLRCTCLPDNPNNILINHGQAISNTVNKSRAFNLQQEGATTNKCFYIISTKVTIYQCSNDMFHLPWYTIAIGVQRQQGWSKSPCHIRRYQYWKWNLIAEGSWYRFCTGAKGFGVSVRGPDINPQQAHSINIRIRI